MMAEAFGRTLSNPWEELRGGQVLGTDSLWDKARRLVKAKEADEELRWTERERAQRVREAMKEIVAMEPDANVRMWARVRLGGERMGEVARDFGYRHQSGVTHAVKRVEELARKDRGLARKLDALNRRLSTFKS